MCKNKIVFSIREPRFDLMMNGRKCFMLIIDEVITARFGKFFRENWLTIFLAFIPAIAIWYFLERDTKELTARVTSDLPVIKADADSIDGLEFKYKGAPILALRAIEIEFQNAGSLSIRKEDYESGIQVAYPGRILGSPQIILGKPPELSPMLSLTSGNEIEIKPLLLNSEDLFKIRVLIDDSDKKLPQLSVRGRIVGVKNINLIANKAQKDADLPVVIVAILAFTSVTFFKMLAQKGISWFDLMQAIAPIGVELLPLLKTPDFKNKTESLSKELGIKNHDVKSNLLLLRLKIESQLRLIGSKLNLESRFPIPARVVIRELAKRNLVNVEIVKTVEKIYSAISRELHDLETYLTIEEFEELQVASLEVVAVLDNIDLTNLRVK